MPLLLQSVVQQGSELHFANTGYGTFAQIQRSTHPGHETSANVLADMLNRYAAVAHGQSLPHAAAPVPSQSRRSDADSSFQRQSSALSQPSQFGGGGTGQSYGAAGGSNWAADPRQGSHYGSGGSGGSGWAAPAQAVSGYSDQRSAQTPHPSQAPQLHQHTGSSAGGDAPPQPHAPHGAPQYVSGGHDAQWQPQAPGAHAPPQYAEGGGHAGWQGQAPAMRHTGDSHDCGAPHGALPPPQPMDDGSGNYQGPRRAAQGAGAGPA